MPPTPGAGVHDDVIGLQSFAYYSLFTVDSRAIQYSVHYFVFFVCNNNNGFIRCALITSMHHRLIRSYTPNFPAALQMAESFELQDMPGRPQRQSTAVIDSDNADGTITAWSLGAFALSVPSPWYFLAGSSP